MKRQYPAAHLPPAEKAQRLRERAELKALRVYVKHITAVAKRQVDLAGSADKDSASVAAARDILNLISARPKAPAVNVNIHNQPTRIVSYLGIPEVAVIDGKPLELSEPPKQIEAVPKNVGGRPKGSKDKAPRKHGSNGRFLKRVVAAEANPPSRPPFASAQPDGTPPPAAAERSFPLPAVPARGVPEALRFPALPPVSKIP